MEKWKNLSIALIIAVILVSILLSYLYIAYANKLKELNEFQEKVED